MKKIVPIIVIICVILGVKMYNKHKASSEVKQQAMEQMQRQLSPLLGEDYVTELVNAAHPDAMDESYNMGGKREGSSFDQDTYRRALHKHMAIKMREDGKSGLAEMLGGGRSY